MHAVSSILLSLLAMQNNNISGTLPSLSGFGDLHILQLGNNNITGTIPHNFGEGKFITSLNLAFNK
jgi:hypothetical protein